MNEVVRVKAKKIRMVNGDEFANVVFYTTEDVLNKFTAIEVGTKTIKINEDFILSIEE